jgi:hypothetical protein
MPARPPANQLRMSGVLWVAHHDMHGEISRHGRNYYMFIY